ncbi:MAG: leucine-rich repeat domain-containing protein [Treponema sp.]|nr:leucine-rich repeat domain-containing protein [Treponema sp.]
MTIPDSVIEIESNAFDGCRKLTRIILFEGCSRLETITLSRMTKAGYRAFEGFSGRLIYRD